MQVVPQCEVVLLLCGLAPGKGRLANILLDVHA
jgi:hypothetical protein